MREQSAEVRNIREIRRGAYEVNGSGIGLYQVRAYKNSGGWGGHILETDNGTKIQFNDGSLSQAIHALEDASRSKVDVTVGGTQVKGESDGVHLYDKQDTIKISDNEARRGAQELREYALRQAAAEEAAKGR